jgi:hypothetical protein
VAIEARQIMHIVRRHGESGKKDSSMKDSSDVGKLQYAMNSPDSLIDGGTTRHIQILKKARIGLLKRFCMKKV